MAKELTKSEIEALAQEIRKTISEEMQEKIEAENEILEAEFYETEPGKAVKAVMELDPTLINNGMVNVRMGKKYNRSNDIYEISRAITIAQIDSQNVQEIIDKVILKFKNDE